MSRLLATYDNYITFEFGDQILQGNSIFHDGIDLVGETYQGWHALDEIKAHTAGTVIEAEFDEGRGNHICISVSDTAYMTYNHLESMYVGVGELVSQGQIIGQMGATGGCTGSHLHWGINEGGEWIDPTEYLENDYIINKVITEHEADIVRVGYVDVLGRMPDESGFKNFTEYLANGGTEEDFYAALLNSDEYSAKLKVSPELVYFTIKCYWLILGRMPEDLQVLENWCSGPASLENKINIFNAIWLSEEADNQRKNES